MRDCSCVAVGTQVVAILRSTAGPSRGLAIGSGHRLAEPVVASQDERMESPAFDEESFYRAVAQPGIRVLLIGRRAMIALGIPVGTWDYDFWLHIDDIEAFNAAALDFDLIPNRTPDEARAVGRYVLEDDDRVDVMIARQVSTKTGEHVRFDDVYARSRLVEVAPGTKVHVPCIPDLIATKRFSLRPQDIQDIRLLEALAKERGE